MATTYELPDRMVYIDLGDGKGKAVKAGSKAHRDARSEGVAAGVRPKVSTIGGAGSKIPMAKAVDYGLVKVKAQAPAEDKGAS